MNDEMDQAKRGWRILRDVTNPAWLAMPAPVEAFAVFRKHATTELLWHYTKAHEDSGIYPHVYDKRAARLGAASGVLLGVGAPEHRHAPAFDGRAGLWHLHIQRVPEALQRLDLPQLYRQADTWQYTPVVQLLTQLGYGYEVVEAYLFPAQHQALRPFYERMKQLRHAALTPAALADVKKMYTATFGTLAHLIDNPSPSYLYRPDWYYSLVAHEKANMFRQLLKVWQQEGQLPRMVHTDCIWYEQPVSSLPIGAGIGQYKYNE